jgi:hypothetical protein
MHIVWRGFLRRWRQGIESLAFRSTFHCFTNKRNTNEVLSFLQEFVRASSRCCYIREYDERTWIVYACDHTLEHPSSKCCLKVAGNALKSLAEWVWKFAPAGATLKYNLIYKPCSCNNFVCFALLRLLSDIYPVWHTSPCFVMRRPGFYIPRDLHAIHLICNTSP